ncbi:MAG TPA: T9SS type A sorting domain-containing protein, partial [Saprospiraceae bacterium]
WWIKESFYDENVDGSTIVWPNPAFYAPVTFHHKPIFDVQYFFDGFEWSFADSLLFFYGNLNTSTFHTKALTANIFPNPATNQMTIQMEELDPSATITFFDLQGKHVGSSPLRSNIPISISGLIPGTYVYQIHNGTEFYSGKILKE